MFSERPYEDPPEPKPLAVNERSIEEDFIGKLRDLKYTHRPDISDRASLESNFRWRFETLNRVKLTDAEFARLLDDLVSPDVFKNSVRLREKNDFTRDDGTPLSYTLVNIKDWCKNDFEVVHQLRINTDYSHHRYDVILLINGVPVVQVELKTLGVNPRRAMEQIVDYKADPGNGYTRTLLCFVQLFIVSNRESTYYFANNNDRHFAFNADEQFLPVYRWSTPDNKPVAHLDLFADRFLQKCDLGRMISRYMVLIQSEQKLLMMRPYQIYAVQSIVDCIDQNNGNGYIWHTTGSGKTLTSFKASTLLKDNPAIDKCLFVVDRKDLDRQTREEFNRFQENCVEENTNTESLVRRFLSDDKADKVIVTTIQKLGLALDATGTRNYRERLAPLRDRRLVFIFDECHRSQFGENHRAIKTFFPRSQLFGFTGTPIFEDNATRVKIEGDQASDLTTEDVFQRELHAYTITHAIEDKNVLKFHVDYFKVEGASSSLPGQREQDAPATPKPGQPLAKRAVVEAILAKHDAATHARRFNALLAAELAALRAQLLADPYFKGVPSMQLETGKTARFFHAKDDLPEVRREVFRVLQRHDFAFYAVVRTMAAVARRVKVRNERDPTYRYRPTELYDGAVRRLFDRKLHTRPAFEVIFASRGKARTEALREHLLKAQAQSRKAAGTFHHATIHVRAMPAHQHAGLQVADYCLWALQRLFTQDEDRFLSLIWPKVGLIVDADDVSEKPYGTYHTSKRRPLTAAGIKNRKVED